MTVKGIIKSIDFGSNTCTVRLPYFENAGNTTEVVVNAIFATTPGIYNNYKVDDVVFVDFENNDFDRAVVVGSLYISAEESGKEGRGAFNVANLTVDGTATIPITTKLSYEGNNKTTVGVEGDLTSYTSIADIARNLQKQETQIGSINAQFIDSGDSFATRITKLEADDIRHESEIRQNAESIEAKVDVTHNGGTSGFSWSLTPEGWKVYSNDSTHTAVKDVGILSVNNEGVKIAGKLEILDYPRINIVAYRSTNYPDDMFVGEGGALPGEQDPNGIEVLKQYWGYDTEDYPGRISPDNSFPVYSYIDPEDPEHTRLLDYRRVYKLACDISYIYNPSTEQLDEVTQNVTYEPLQELDANGEPITHRLVSPKINQAWAIANGAYAIATDKSTVYYSAIDPVDFDPPVTLKQGDCWFDTSAGDTYNTTTITINGINSHDGGTWEKPTGQYGWDAYPYVYRFNLLKTFSRYADNTYLRGDAQLSKGTWIKSGGFGTIKSLSLCFRGENTYETSDALVLLIPRTDTVIENGTEVIVDSLARLQLWFEQKGSITVIYKTWNNSKNLLKQWTADGNAGYWEDIGGEIVANKVTANYVNALDIEAKKIEIFDSDNNTLFKASGLPGETDTNKVKIAGFDVGNDLTGSGSSQTGGPYIKYHTIGDTSSVLVSPGYQKEISSLVSGKKTWAFTASNSFGVDTGGSLYANNANITGNINAENGHIGNFGISGGNITSENLNITENSLMLSSNSDNNYIQLQSNYNYNNASIPAILVSKYGLVANSDLTAGFMFSGDGATSTVYSLKFTVEGVSRYEPGTYSSGWYYRLNITHVYKKNTSSSSEVELSDDTALPETFQCPIYLYRSSYPNDYILYRLYFEKGTLVSRIKQAYLVVRSEPKQVIGIGTSASPESYSQNTINTTVVFAKKSSNILYSFGSIAPREDSLYPDTWHIITYNIRRNIQTINNEKYYEFDVPTWSKWGSGYETMYYWNGNGPCNDFYLYPYHINYSGMTKSVDPDVRGIGRWDEDTYQYLIEGHDEDGNPIPPFSDPTPHGSSGTYPTKDYDGEASFVAKTSATKITSWNQMDEYYAHWGDGTEHPCLPNFSYEYVWEIKSSTGDGHYYCLKDPRLVQPGEKIIIYVKGCYLDKKSSSPANTYITGGLIPIGILDGRSHPDGMYNIGDEKYRWENAYIQEIITTNVDNFSDIKIKTDLSYDLTKYNNFFDNLKPASFTFKNGSSNRTHLGFIAQDINQNLINNNLTRKDFAGIVISGKGFDKNKDKILNEEETDYYIRYSELHALEVYEIQELKKRVRELENALLQMQINNSLVIEASSTQEDSDSNSD